MKKLITVVFFLAFTFSTMQAQGIAIGPHVGYYKAKNATEGSVLFGGTLRLKLSSAFAIEGTIGYKQEKYDNGDIKVTGYPVTASALIYILPIVYGEAGAGWYNTKTEYSGVYSAFDDETNSDFGYHFGGGVELALDHVILTGDIKYVFLKYKFDKVPGQEVDANFYVISAGILFEL
jgi:opacity protein-like surface antigen